VTVDSRSAFESLPDELEVAITGHLADEKAKPSEQTVSMLTLISHRFYLLNQPDRLNLALLQQIAKAKLSRVKEMLEEQKGRLDLLYPLLMNTGTSTDLSRRTHTNVTALQLAFGAQDVEMCELLLSYFAKLPDGYKKALKQIEAMFPDATQVALSEDFKASCYGLFIFDERGGDKKETFDAFIKASKEDSFRHNCHLNLKQLKFLASLYSDYFLDRDFGLVWREGIGYLETQLPACHASALCTGLIKLQSGDPLVRSLKLGDGTDFFPQEGDVSQLGRDFAVDGGGEKLEGGDLRNCSKETSFNFHIADYIEANEKALSAFRDKLKALCEETFKLGEEDSSEKHNELR
jgi:hypothetical protein